MGKTFTIAWLLVIFMIYQSCTGEKVYTPKPRMYPRIEYPVNKGYRYVNLKNCMMTFEIPSYASINWDIKQLPGEPKHPCWFDLEFKDLNSTIHFSFYSLKKNHLTDLINDAFRLASEHNIKADYRNEIPVKNPKGITGLRFEMGGPVASPVSFYLTDSLDHYVRASLYFNSKVNPDSTAPVLKFLNNDIDRIIKSFRFEALSDLENE